ncbi:hypothetical protein P5673_002401 [Acropora cervicornis]|uniref:DDE Tnp4 domain-containing protein n=1 Tax=Acropora cervicornis TaxID=6130 RepID=A0AAD9R347_ACRCE|nr:hypothetical protein P5673_002401 [Acropora cervicornis]
MFEQLMRDLHSLQRQVTRLRKPVPVKTVVAMLLKRIGKGLDYREIGDKFGIGTSTACMKVNEAMKLLNYPGSNLTPEKEHFNYSLSRARIQIERAYGRLKGRWRCLLKGLDCDLDKVVLHVTSACIMHNMCEERKECYLEEWNRLAEDETGDLPRPDLLNDNDADDNANIIRNALARYLYN